jgi:hypothetical protein
MRPFFGQKQALQFSPGDSELIEAIASHLEKTIGPVDGILHELVSKVVHVDINHIAPAEGRPFHVLATSGMSERPLNVKKEAGPVFATELMAFLAPEIDWSKHWMVFQLQLLAKAPHLLDSFFGPGHTAQNYDPPEPYSPNTELMCMMFLPAGHLLAGSDVGVFKHPHVGSGMFLQCVPIYRNEMNFGLEHGTEELTRRLVDQIGLENLLIIRDNRPQMT